MAKSYEREEPAELPVTWAVYCPDEPKYTFLGTWPYKGEAERAAEEHNAEFTPPHNAAAEEYVPDPGDPDPPPPDDDE